MSNPTTLELTRRQVENLYFALQALKPMAIPSRARYALARTLSSISPEIEASQAAFPRPAELVDGAVVQWEIERAAHMAEVVRLPVWLLEDLPDIDPANLIAWRPNMTPVQANLLHQDIVESLLVLLPAEVKPEASQTLPCPPPSPS